MRTTGCTRTTTRHALCGKGTHDDTQLSEHLHVCEVCDWDWAPEGPQPDFDDPRILLAHEAQPKVGLCFRRRCFRTNG